MIFCMKACLDANTLSKRQRGIFMKSKRFLVVLVLAVSALVCLSAGNDLNVGIEMDWCMYGGAHFQQYSINDFKNVRISDYARYGSSEEGSLLLNLEDANGKGLAIGGFFGMRGDKGDDFELIVEAQIDYVGNKSFLINAQVGGIYKLVDAKFKLGVGAKAGYYMFDKMLGTAEILQGTTPPVILSTGTIRNGDSISYSVSGISATPFLDVSYKVGRNIAIGFMGGYQLGIQITSSLTAGENVNISPEKNPEAFYEPTASGFYRTSFDPKVSVNGFTGSVYCSYVF